jgi:hypothetical protein
MQKFDMKNPSDRAKLLPGYYWVTNYSYYKAPSNKPLILC